MRGGHCPCPKAWSGALKEAGCSHGLASWGDMSRGGCDKAHARVASDSRGVPSRGLEAEAAGEGAQGWRPERGRLSPLLLRGFQLHMGIKVT